MHIHHVNCGTMCPVGARLVNGTGGVLDRARMVCHCLIVESAHGLVLVDTGLGTADLADPRGRLGPVFPLVTLPRLSPEETALAHVARLGARRADVRHIVPTHLDVDHAGGLSDFPDAEVHVYAPEHDAALHPRTAHERGRYRHKQWAHGPRWRVHQPGGGEQWFGFDAVRALDGTDDEVLLIPLTGHTRGHCGVAVRTAGGWLLHAGDAYFHHEELDPERPRCTPALALFQRIVAADDLTRRRNQQRLRKLARDRRGEVTIFSAHSAVELDALAAPAAVPLRTVA